MTETLILALLAGMLLGLFFFGGLWLTVRKAMQAKAPAPWFLLSFLLRMAVALFGFYVISNTGKWQHLALALLGFVIARTLFISQRRKPLADSEKGQGRAS